MEQKLYMAMELSDKCWKLAPLLIVIKLEEYGYAGATAVAAAMLVLSFALLLIINALQAWTNRYRTHRHVEPALPHPVLQGAGA